MSCAADNYTFTIFGCSCKRQEQHKSPLCSEIYTFRMLYLTSTFESWNVCPNPVHLFMHYIHTCMFLLRSLSMYGFPLTLTLFRYVGMVLGILNFLEHNIITTYYGKQQLWNGRTHNILNSLCHIKASKIDLKCLAQDTAI